MPQNPNQPLVDKCRSIKLRFVEMYRKAGAGHIGCALSCAEMLTFVRFGWMADADDLVLSKGHAAAALYSVLAEGGELSEDEIETFYRDGTFLSAHPPPNKLPRTFFGTGSLGHGLSLAAGFAMAAKLKGETHNSFCITSDGELNEGSIWEAALFAAQENLNSLYWLIDRNGLQGFGRTEEVMKLEPLADKIRAFGWDAFEVDGHDFRALDEAKRAIGDRPDNAKPAAIICRTTKGRGYADLEDQVDCHYLPFNDATYLATRDKIRGENGA